MILARLRALRQARRRRGFIRDHRRVPVEQAPHFANKRAGRGIHRSGS